MADQGRQPERTRRTGERFTFSVLVTNSIKLGGLVIALHEGLGGPQIDARVIGLAALMMAGGQSLEVFFAAFFGVKK